MKINPVILLPVAISLLCAQTGRTQDPTDVRIWDGDSSTARTFVTPENWDNNVGPAALSSNVLVFTSVDNNPAGITTKPSFGASFGTTIVIYSNTVAAKLTDIAGGANTMWLGSFLRSESSQTLYLGQNTTHYKLGDATVGSQTDFQIMGGLFVLYNYVEDGQDGLPSKVVKSGPGVMRLSGNAANTYSGGTIVSGGTLTLDKNANVTAIPGNVTIHSGAVLDTANDKAEEIADTAVITVKNGGTYKPGATETVESVESDAGDTTGIISTVGRLYNNNTLIVQPDATKTYNSGTGVSSFHGSVTGGGTLTMNGTGEYRMLGSANAVANINVNAGILRVNGNSGTGPVQVNTGATLLGTGTLAGAVTVAYGASIGAGGSAGALTLANGLDLSQGGTNIWELAALSTSNPGADFDQIVLTGGNLSLGGASSTLSLRFIGTATPPDAGDPFWLYPHSWTVISVTGAADNPGPTDFAVIENGSFAAGNFSTAVVGKSVVLTFTPSGTPPAPKPVITSVTGAGTASVTVNYSNTVASTNYTLQYNTNLSSANWYNVGTKAAPGNTDSQTDATVIPGEKQRYYRIRVQ